MTSYVIPKPGRGQKKKKKKNIFVPFCSEDQISNQDYQVQGKENVSVHFQGTFGFGSPEQEPFSLEVTFTALVTASELRPYLLRHNNPVRRW